MSGPHPSAVVLPRLSGTASVFWGEQELFAVYQAHAVYTTVVGRVFFYYFPCLCSSLHGRRSEV